MVVSALNGKIGNLTVSYKNVTGSTPVTFTAVNEHQYLIVVTSGNETHTGLFIVQGGASTAYPYKMAGGNALSISAEGLNVSITKSSSRAVYVVIYDYDYSDE